MNTVENKHSPVDDAEALEMFRWLESRLLEHDQFVLQKIITNGGKPVIQLRMTGMHGIVQVGSNLGAIIRSFRE